MSFLEILVLVSSLTLIGLVSVLESIHASTDSLRLEISKKKGTLYGKTWSVYMDNPTRFSGALLIAYTFSLVVYGFMIWDLLLPVWKYLSSFIATDKMVFVQSLQWITQTAMASAIILFIHYLASSLYKSTIRSVDEASFLLRLSGYLYAFFGPLASWLVRLAEWILTYVFNVKTKRKKVVFEQEHDTILQQSMRIINQENTELNKEMFENALTLTDTRIRKCMVPRGTILGFSVNTPMLDVKQQFIETKHSRLIVFDADIDNIIGYIHALDLLKQGSQVADFLHPIPSVPETMKVGELIHRFRKEGKSIAWVIDEFGGTAGIVTMEDMLEEIFGEIEDEYDQPESEQEQALPSGEYLFSGQLRLSYLKDKYKISIANNSHTQTLSGYIIEYNNEIPKKNERIIIDHFELEILNVSETRIEQVKLKKLDE
ncbi:MAG: hemolysin family protein [Ferruginibacter sp.]